MKGTPSGNRQAWMEIAGELRKENKNERTDRVKGESVGSRKSGGCAISNRRNTCLGGHDIVLVDMSIRKG